LLLPSPDDTADESSEILHNQLATVREGRDPNATLVFNGRDRNLRQWASELLDLVDQVALAIDVVSGTTQHQASARAQRHKVTDARLTPSARIIKEMNDQQVSFFRLVMSLSENHRQAFTLRNELIVLQ